MGGAATGTRYERIDESHRRSGRGADGAAESSPGGVERTGFGFTARTGSHRRAAEPESGGSGRARRRTNPSGGARDRRTSETARRQRRDASGELARGSGRGEVGAQSTRVRRDRGNAVTTAERDGRCRRRGATEACREHRGTFVADRFGSQRRDSCDSGTTCQRTEGGGRADLFGARTTSAAISRGGEE